jgi:hypothetical protein
MERKMNLSRRNKRFEPENKQAIITICSIKRKENFFFTVFFLHENKKTVEKSLFFLLNMKFCFMKRLFYTALEEIMSVARVKRLLTSGGSSLF